ncbi:hypothetical protein MKK84_30800 [Methylobacterium sp. E-065]|uniref:hypothetical protein n=1 Tax=Methylobacterium sp. E-065 TaxID=2836583 RepID=UPI001FBB1E00|nr:hypothetical protein [Methylobacterium sp. E-065]MCJ2021750.1 hypothetical protein [Methylobacterium sp. E-065]
MLGHRQDERALVRHQAFEEGVNWYYVLATAADSIHCPAHFVIKRFLLRNSLAFCFVRLSSSFWIHPRDAARIAAWLHGARCGLPMGRGRNRRGGYE